MEQDKWSCLLCATLSTESVANTFMERNLDVVFVLRNLLEVPRIQLESQLKKCGGANPENWIRLCDKCTQLTRTARKLNEEIRTLEKQLGKVKKQATELIKSSTGSCKKEGGKYTRFQEKIRSFVKEKDYDDANDKPGYLEGDKLAKCLASQQFSDEIKEEIESPPPSPPQGSPPPTPPPPAPPVEELVYLCDHCGQKFVNETLLKKHVAKMHKVFKFRCPICGKSILKKAYFQLHLLRNHSEDPITKRLHEEAGVFDRKCSVIGCPARFMKQGEEECHMEKVHSGGGGGGKGKPFKCRICGRGFWGRFACWRHERLHEVKGRRVIYNRKWGPSKAEAEEGARNDKPFELELCLDKRFKCGECGKSWDKVRNWSEHVWKTHQVGEVTCPGEGVGEEGGCGRIFKGGLDEFVEHWNATHRKKGGKGRRRKGGNVGVTCGICGRELRNKYYLNTHVRIVHEKKFGWRCELCGWGTEVGTELKRHLLMRHGGEEAAKRLGEEEGLKLVRCGVKGCGRSFLREELLTKHNEKWHEGKEGEESGLKCKVCGKGFWGRAKLGKHERTHEGESGKKNKCGSCGMRFRRKDHLKSHELKVHMEVKTVEILNFNKLV